MSIRRAGIAAVATVLAVGCALPAAARDPLLEIPGAQVYTARGSALGDDAIFHIAASPSGEIWVATARGVTIVDAAGGMRTVEALGRGVCHQIAFALDGSAWVHCGPAQLFVQEGAAWSEVKLPAEGYSVMGLAFDGGGRPWVATNLGLYARTDGAWNEVALPFGGVLQQGAVRCIAAHPGGFLYAQFLELGLLRIDATTLATVRVADGGCPLRVDRAGNAWFANDDGFHRLSRGSNGAAVLPERIAALRVLDIAFDLHDRPWVSTRLGGIRLYDRGIWTALAPEQPGRVEEPFGSLSLAFDRDGNLWTGAAIARFFRRAEGSGLLKVPGSALPGGT